MLPAARDGTGALRGTEPLGGHRSAAELGAAPGAFFFYEWSSDPRPKPRPASGLVERRGEAGGCGSVSGAGGAAAAPRDRDRDRDDAKGRTAAG